MTYDTWKMTNPADEFLGSEPPPCERNYVGRIHQHPRFPSGFCVECHAEAHQSCKHLLAVSEWEPKEE